jgi:hypothetical protein
VDSVPAGASGCGSVDRRPPVAASACAGHPERNGESILGYEHSAGGAPYGIDVEVAEPEILSLEPVEVRRLIWEGVMLLDARSERDRANVPHTVAVPLCHRASPQALQLLCGDRQEPLVCASNGERRARRLAVRLNRLGYRHVYVLRGGLAGLQRQSPL